MYISVAVLCAAPAALVALGIAAGMFVTRERLIYAREIIDDDAAYRRRATERAQAPLVAEVTAEPPAVADEPGRAATAWAAVTGTVSELRWRVSYRDKGDGLPPPPRPRAGRHRPRKIRRQRRREQRALLEQTRALPLMSRKDLVGAP